MNSDLVPLAGAVARVDAAWGDATDVTGLFRAGLLAVNEALASLGRVVDALKVEVAAGIAHESRRELGPDSLAKQQGFRSPVQLIAVTTGASTGDAARLVRLGEVTARRRDLSGAPRPSGYPAVQEALACGGLGALAAGLIVALLDRVRLKGRGGSGARGRGSAGREGAGFVVG